MKKSQKWGKVNAFFLTFLGYASLAGMRYSWSFSKSDLQKQMNVGYGWLGMIDCLYLISYSSGMAILGSWSSKLGLINYVVGGIILSSLFLISFPVLYALTSYFSVTSMTIVVCINAFFMATGCPGLIALLNNWFAKDKKGVIMAAWAVCGNFGNIVASFICGGLHQINFQWYWNFIVTGGLAIAVGFSIYRFLPESPQKQKTIVIKMDEEIVKQKKQQPIKQELSLVNLIKIPRMINYIVGYCCLKGCIYGLLFWLPTFLSLRGQRIMQSRGSLCAMIQLGSLSGGIIVGYLADRYQKRALLMTPLLFLSSILLCVVSFMLNDDPQGYFICLFIIGCALGGPYNIIGTVIAMDISHSLNGRASTAQVSSLIEGSASFFTAIQMLIIPLIPFTGIFYLFGLMSLSATCALIPIFIQQFHNIWNPQQKQLQLQFIEMKQKKTRIMQ